MSRRSSEEILLDALGHFDRMQAHAGHDLEDQLVIDAVCMRLSAGIETLATLDLAVRADLFGEDWRLMWGMRNRIAHGYLLVDSSIIRQTVTHDIPGIVARIRHYLDTGGRG